MKADPSASSASVHRTNDRMIEGGRMSFGDHLDELRKRVLLALVGAGVGGAFCLYFGKEIVAFICRPLFAVQQAVGLHPQMQVLSPTGLFSAYLRIALLSGLIVAMPWVLWQAWQFIAAGLYTHEKRFVRLLMPISFGLFGLGVVFLYYVTLPIALWFFVTFNASFPIGDLTPSALQRLLLPAEAPAVVAEEHLPPLNVPCLSEDPSDAKIGDLWVNAATRRLTFMSPSGLLSSPLDVGAAAGVMQSQFAIDEYLAFVLLLSLAFGVAFETPVVVFFLAWTGLVSTATMRRFRRYVIFAIVVIGAVLTPPDVLSQVLLATPMYLLFELGVLVARIGEKKAT